MQLPQDPKEREVLVQLLQEVDKIQTVIDAGAVQITDIEARAKAELKIKKGDFSKYLKAWRDSTTIRRKYAEAEELYHLADILENIKHNKQIEDEDAVY